MKILHILSANILAGSVFYAISLAERHLAEGHEVFLLSDRDKLPTHVPSIALPINDRRYIQRFKSISFIKKFIKQHDIQVVHAHSRAASWLSYFAVRGTKIPLISTIHGRQHIHNSVQLFDIYGDRVIAICENLKTHLVNEVKMKAEKITLLANSFDFENIDAIMKNLYDLETSSFKENTTTLDKQKENIVISFMGRMNGGKGEILSQLLERVFPSLLEKNSELIINLVGGQLEELPQHGQHQFHALNKIYDNRIKAIGFVKDVPAWVKNSTLIIGAGRVAIEAIYLDTAVLALGEATCHGIVNEANIAECLASNFGDILPTKTEHKHDYEQISNDLSYFLSQPQTNKKQQTRNNKQETTKNLDNVLILTILLMNYWKFIKLK